MVSIVMTNVDLIILMIYCIELKLSYLYHSLSGKHHYQILTR